MQAYASVQNEKSRRNMLINLPKNRKELQQFHKKEKKKQRVINDNTEKR